MFFNWRDQLIYLGGIRGTEPLFHDYGLAAHSLQDYCHWSYSNRILVIHLIGVTIHELMRIPIACSIGPMEGTRSHNGLSNKLPLSLQMHQWVLGSKVGCRNIKGSYSIDCSTPAGAPNCNLNSSSCLV